jgi:hypothetical protein
MEIADETIDLLLGALADQLQAPGGHAEIVVIGGSALTALGLVRRAIRLGEIIRRYRRPLP